LGSAPAMAQFGNPAGALPNPPEARPGEPSPDAANVPDRLFVQLLGMGNAGEVAAARLADTRARDPGVKAFARRMVADHGDAARKLAAAAGPLGVPVPSTPDPDQRATQARLEGLQGATFDVAYLQAQVIDHQKAVLLLHWVLGNGENPRLQAFAKETLPAVQDHLRHVQALLAQATATAPPTEH